jgi:histone H3/H4
MVRAIQIAQKSHANDPRNAILARKIDAIRQKKPVSKIPIADSNEENFFKDSKKKKPRRSGSMAIREIKRYSKSVQPLLQKMPFQRVVREIAQDILPHDSVMSYRFQSEALDALQIATESLLVELLAVTNAQTVKCKRETITVDDMRFMMIHRDSLSTIYHQMMINEENKAAMAKLAEDQERAKAKLLSERSFPKKSLIPDDA